MPPANQFIKVSLLFILLAPFLAYGSNDSIPSKLKKDLLTVTNDSSKAIILKNICWYYRYSNLDSCVFYGKKAIAASKIWGNKKLEEDVARSIGVSYWHYAYEEESIEWIYTSLKIAEEIHDLSGQGYCFDNIGKSFYSQGFYQKALDYFKKAESFFRNLKDNQGLAYAYLHCSWVYLEMNKLDSALQASQASLDIRLKGKDGYLVNGAMGAVADVYRAMGKYTDALQMYRTIQSSKDTTYSHFGYADFYQQIAETYRLAGNNDSAIYYATKSLDMALQYKNYRQVIKTSRTLQTVYTGQKNYERALYYQNLYYQNKERLLTDKAGLKLARKDAEQEYNIIAEHIRSRSILIASVLSLLLITAFIVVGISYFKNKKIRIYNSMLEQKNIEINKQKQVLETQTIELSRLNDIKNKMFSVVSHDIRSPLISLQSMFYLYNNKHITPEEVIQLMPSVEKHVNNTANFVDDLLYWAKSQFAGLKIAKTNFGLHECIYKEVVLLESKAAEKNIVFKWSDENKCTVLADKNMIAIAIRNLLNNAVKFTKQDGCITISCDEENDEIIVCIKDEGNGMNEQKMASLFVSDISTTGTADELGVGLGLILSKDFIEANDGRIWVTSELGNGSSFYIALKRAS